MWKYLWSKFCRKIRGSAIKNSNIHKSVRVGAGSNILGSVIEKCSYVGYDCEIINCNIGKYCSIGKNVTIGGIEHPVSWVSTSSVFYSAEKMGIRNAGGGTICNV